MSEEGMAVGRRCGRLLSKAALPMLVLLASLSYSPRAGAGAFIDGANAIHPACVQALVMSEADSVPVTTAVSLEGCGRSRRSQSKILHDGERLLFEDPAILGEGSFGYRHLSTLDNGIFILGIVRIAPDGSERISLAAVDIAARPTLRQGEVVQRKVLEMVGEVWLPDIQVASLRVSGNVVSFSAGVGRDRVERTVDLSRIGKARDKKK